MRFKSFNLQQVREKKQKLADSEADLVKRHRESKEKLEQQKRDLETRVAAFQQEKVTWTGLRFILCPVVSKHTLRMIYIGKAVKGKYQNSRTLKCVRLYVTISKYTRCPLLIVLSAPPRLNDVSCFNRPHGKPPTTCRSTS